MIVIIWLRCLVLPKFLRRENNFGTGQKAKPGDQELPADNDDHRPGRQRLVGNQADEGRGGEDLVSRADPSACRNR